MGNTRWYLAVYVGLIHRSMPKLISPALVSSSRSQTLVCCLLHGIDQEDEYVLDASHPLKSACICILVFGNNFHNSSSIASYVSNDRTSTKSCPTRPAQHV